MTTLADDPFVAAMREDGIPVTRENWIEMNYTEIPTPWTAEMESELPEELQDWSKVITKDGAD